MLPPAAPSPPLNDRLRDSAWAVLLISAALVIIYANSFQASWHLDDRDNIVENRNVHAERLDRESLSRALYGRNPAGTKLSRPLAYLTFALNHLQGGLAVGGYHLVNFLLHLAAALVLHRLIRAVVDLWTPRREPAMRPHEIALLAALFWAIHPMHVTAVTYLVQRMSLMAGLFMLLAMTHYLRWRTARGNPIIDLGLVLLNWLLAMGSKETAALLPLSLALVEGILIPPQNARGGGKRIVMGCLLAALGLTVLFFYPGAAALENGYAQRTFTLGERLLTQPRVIWLYLGLLFCPTSERFMLLHDIPFSRGLLDPWTTLPALVGLCGATIGAWWLRRRHPLLSFAWLFFLANHLLEGSFLPLEMVFEHRNYLPSALLFLPLALALSKLAVPSRRGKIQAAATVGVAALLLFNQGHTTWMRNAVMADEVTLWQDNAHKAPELKRPHLNLASALSEQGRMDEALHELLLALTAKACQNYKSNALPYVNFGRYFFAAGDFQSAANAFRKATEFSIQIPEAQEGLRRALSALSQQLGIAERAEIPAEDTPSGPNEKRPSPLVMGAGRP
jgi:tetratricopeptide (TPR) repeat protein